MSGLLCGSMLCWKSTQAYVLLPLLFYLFVLQLSLFITEQFLILEKWRKSRTQKQNSDQVKEANSGLRAGCTLKDTARQAVVVHMKMD